MGISTENKSSGNRLRLWPAILIVCLSMIATIGVWVLGDVQRQDRIIRTTIIGLAEGALLMLWLLFASGLRWKTRGLLFGAILFLAVMIGFNFRVRGVTGDLLPIFEWRWKKERVLATPAAVPSTNAALASPVPQPHLSFPQFMGPTRDGIIAGVRLETNWLASPPQLLWRVPVGQAWSGFAIAGERSITMEQRGEDEAVVAYDLTTGKVLWSHIDPAKYSTTIAGEGPRTTPSISSNRVYTFGATGILNCLDLNSGKVLWSTNSAQQFGAGIPEWGFSSSPLVHEGRVYVFVGKGASLACFDAISGQHLWSAGDQSPQYSSPVFATVAGVPQILCFQKEIWGCSLEGKELWNLPWPGGQPRVSLPVVVSTNEVLFSSGYGAGAELLRFKNSSNQLTPERVWKSLQLKSKFGPILRKGGYVYALDDGIFTCIDLATGQRQWKDGRYGHGQGLLIGEQILITTEAGKIVLIQPDPAELKDVATCQVFDEKTWNPPAFAGEFLLVRNHLEAACFRLKLQQAQPLAIR